MGIDISTSIFILVIVMILIIYDSLRYNLIVQKCPSTSGLLDGIYWKLYDRCCEDIGDGENGGDDEPGKWNNEDTGDELREHRLHLISFGTFSAEYIRESDKYEEKSENYVDDIGDKYPYLMEDGTESENLSEGPIGREEPSCEHNKRGDKEGKDADKEIGDIDKCFESLTFWFRFFIIGSWGCCRSSSCFYCHRSIDTTLR